MFRSAKSINLEYKIYRPNNTLDILESKEYFDHKFTKNTQLINQNLKIYLTIETLRK